MMPCLMLHAFALFTFSNSTAPSSRTTMATSMTTSIRDMIPWCFAYDCLNYARYLTFYYAQMSSLDIHHPEMYEYFMSGGFSVQIGADNPFGKIPVDQTIEETINKDTQTSGGTRGFSLNPGAIRRYYVNAEYHSMFLHRLRAMLGTRSSTSSHPDLQKKRIEKDESVVQSITDLIQNSNKSLQIRRGLSREHFYRRIGPQQMLRWTFSLLKALAKRHTRSSRLNVLKRRHRDAVDFHATIKKQKLKTFANVCTKKSAMQRERGHPTSRSQSFCQNDCYRTRS